MWYFFSLFFFFLVVFNVLVEATYLFVGMLFNSEFVGCVCKVFWGGGFFFFRIALIFIFIIDQVVFLTS